MKLFFLSLFIFFLAVLAACRPPAEPVSISNKPISSRNTIPRANLPLPPNKPIGQMTWTKFDGATNEDGDRQRIGDLQGKVVVLDFWATYCPPCLEEIPHLNELQTRYGDRGLEVIGLHVGGEEDRPRVPAFAEKLRIGYTLATPEDDLTGFVFQNDNTIPQTLVLDREGKLVDRFVGYDLKIKNDLDRAIERALEK